MEIDEALTHACAGLALAYAWRAAGFAASWIDVPLLDAAPEPPLPDAFDHRAPRATKNARSKAAYDRSSRRSGSPSKLS